MKMKIATIEKTVAGGNRTAQKIRRVRTGTRRSDAVQPLAAADQQVAEIERTFSVRWEW
jgi:hypothetical protein